MTGRVYYLLAYLGSVFVLAAECLGGVFYGASPRRWRWTSFQMLHIGIGSLTVCGVIVFMIGMVISLQTAYQMRQLGTEALIPGLVAVSIARELGPMITALVVAGRAGAAITAEIGSMAVTEQVDALEAMSVSPVEHLVVPRFLAMTALLPVLTVYADFFGVIGGYVVCVSKLGMSQAIFTSRVFDTLKTQDLWTGLAKSLVFGALIAWVSCAEGLKVRGGAGGVGLATMRSVVASFLLIVFADFIFTTLFFM